MRFSTVVLALMDLTMAFETAVSHSTTTRSARPWQRSNKARGGRNHRRSHHAEPDRNRQQRPFRGGRVRHPMFEGSGCPTDSVALVNSSDTSSFALSALFSQFQAQTSAETLRDRRTCVITVALEPEENMSIGVAHVDFRGSAYVPVGASGSASDARAHLRASYSITGTSHSRIANTTYAGGFDDQFYESFDVSETAWTPCELPTRGSGVRRIRSRARVFEFRIFTTISATKPTASDPDVAIAVDTSDATLQKGVYYELTTRPCPTAPNAT